MDQWRTTPSAGQRVELSIATAGSAIDANVEGHGDRGVFEMVPFDRMHMWYLGIIQWIVRWTFALIEDKFNSVSPVDRLMSAFPLRMK